MNSSTDASSRQPRRQRVFPMTIGPRTPIVGQAWDQRTAHSQATRATQTNATSIPRSRHSLSTLGCVVARINPGLSVALRAHHAVHKLTRTAYKENDL